MVITHVMDDLKDESRYHLVDLFGEGAFYDTLEEALQAYRQVTGSGE